MPRSPCHSFLLAGAPPAWMWAPLCLAGRDDLDLDLDSTFVLITTKISRLWATPPCPVQLPGPEGPEGPEGLSFL